MGADKAMITIQQHIDQQHGGNVSAFARSVSASRPTVYSWLQRGSIWHAGRVWDPVTPRKAVTELMALRPTIPAKAWDVCDGKVWIKTEKYDINVLNAADLAAMTEALNNAS